MRDEWFSSSYLPVLDIQTTPQIYPFLQLLAWYSYAYHEKNIKHMESVRTVRRKTWADGLDPEEDYDDISIPFRDTFKPSVFPMDGLAKDFLSPPEDLRAAFLGTEGYIEYSMGSFKYDKSEEDHIMYYTTQPFGDRSSLSHFIASLQQNAFADKFDRDGKKIDNKSPQDIFYDSLCSLWNIFPLCDYRIEIAYQVFDFLKNPLSSKDEPVRQCECDIDFLTWAMRKDRSENIALRYLWDQRFKIESTEKLPEGVRNIFSSKSQTPQKRTSYNIPTQKEIRALHKFQKDCLNGEEYAFTRQLPKFYDEWTYGQWMRDDIWIPRIKSDENPIAKEIFDQQADISSCYLDLDSGYFFRNLYLDQYREACLKRIAERSNVTDSSLAHPLYDFLPSTNMKSLSLQHAEDTLFFSLAQDVYSMRNFDHWLVEDRGSLTNYCISQKQKALFDHIEKQKRSHAFGRRKRRVAFSFIKSLTFSRDKHPEVLLKHSNDPLLEPRACALYRIAILPPETSFEKKMDAIGLPYQTGSMEIMSEMANLMSWLHSSTPRAEDNTALPNHWTVSTLYLAAKIKEYFGNCNAEDYKKIAETASKLTKLEQLAVEECPELLLVATFSETYNESKKKKSYTLDKFPFSVFQGEIDYYRFRKKCISQRDQFKADFSSIMKNYNLIKSDEWFYSLNKEMNAYIASKANANSKPSTNTILRPSP